ncbi:hypothetical protein [Agrobacterium pusense]|uniref:hypothetical protein n=1 Tax=Agrobacterium pusense TaxID=648995 RepID=UPI003FCF7814
MPVNAETIVEVRMASGFEYEADLAGNWLEREGSKSNWHHDLGCPHPCDIVAYHIVTNSPALSAQAQDVAGEHVAWRLRHKNDGPHMWEYYQLPEAEASDNLVIQKLTIKQLIDILNDDKHAGAQERPPEPHSPNASVPIDLLQKIWAEMYYGVGGEGGIDDSIAQWNLNEVVDILAMAGALPDVDEPAAPAKQEG